MEMQRKAMGQKKLMVRTLQIDECVKAVMPLPSPSPSLSARDIILVSGVGPKGLSRKRWDVIVIRMLTSFPGPCDPSREGARGSRPWHLEGKGCWGCYRDVERVRLALPLVPAAWDLVPMVPARGGCAGESGSVQPHSLLCWPCCG